MLCKACKLFKFWQRYAVLSTDSMEDMMKLDIYELFGISVDAEEKEIKHAYRKKALECHPDKNPGDPKAAALFHQLSRALEILTDPKARDSYDKVLKARKAAAIRHRELDNEAKRFKLDLETKEKAEQERKDQLDAERRLEEEIKRLQAEGSRLVEEEKARMREQLVNERAEASSPPGKQPTTPPTLKVQWKAEKNDPENGGYSEEDVRAALEKCGELTCLILSKKKKGSALVEFGSTKAAVSATTSVLGNPDNPLKLTWISGEPLVEVTTNNYTDPPSTTTNCIDYESVVMMNMRRAAERQRLIEKMLRLERSRSRNCGHDCQNT